MSCCGVDLPAAGSAAPAAAQPIELVLTSTTSVNFAAQALPASVSITNAATILQGAADLNVLLAFPQNAELSSVAIWEDRAPEAWDFTTGTIELELELAGDGSAAAEASFGLAIERTRNFNVLTNQSYGSSQSLAAAITVDAGEPSTYTFVFATSASRDGLRGNEPFRFRLTRGPLDAYAGQVVFVRGVLRFVTP